MNKKKKITIISTIITIVVVGLLSLIPYIIEEKRYEAKPVTPKDEFKIGKMVYKMPIDFSYQLANYTSDYKNYTFGEGASYCDINIELHRYDDYEVYESGEQYIRERVYITIADEYETYTDNGWYTLDIKSKDYSSRKVSAIKYGKDLYVIDYTFNDFSKGENKNSEEQKKCSTAYDYVFKSIFFEK